MRDFMMALWMRAGIASIAILPVIATAAAGCGDDGDVAGGACAPDCEARTVSRGLGPRKLAVDDQNVYWIDGFNNNDQTIRRAPRGGADSTTLTTGANLADLVIDATTVYFSDEGKVRKVAKQGGTAETLADKESGVAGLALVGGQLFWTSTNGVRSMPITGGAPTTISKGTYAGSNSLFRVVVDDKYVYWANNGDIFRVPRAGGDPIKLRSGPGSVIDLALDGSGSLYFAMGSFASEKGVYAVSIEGGTPAVAAASDGDVQGIAIEGGALYWSDTSGGRVMGPQGPIAKSTRPGRLVVNAGSLFWVDDRESNVKAVGP